MWEAPLLRGFAEMMALFMTEPDRHSIIYLLSQYFLQPQQFANAIGVFGDYPLSDSIQFVYPE